MVSYQEKYLHNFLALVKEVNEQHEFDPVFLSGEIQKSYEANPPSLKTRVEVFLKYYKLKVTLRKRK